MARYEVTTTATARIRETFIVEADDEAAAEAAVLSDDSEATGGVIIDTLPDETIGEEEDRAVERVEQMPEPAPKTRQAIFQGQAWIRGNATDVDESRSEFGITEDEYVQAGGDDAAGYDALQNAADAPDWVRNWPGPFDIEVNAEIEGDGRC